MKFRNIIQHLLEEMSDEELTLYHASPYRFDKFRIDKIGTGSGRKWNGWGIYLSTSLSSIKDYGENIYQVKLKPNLLLIDREKPLDKNLFTKLIASIYKYKNQQFDVSKFNLYYEHDIKTQELKAILWGSLKEIDPDITSVGLGEVIDDANKDLWFHISNYTEDNEKVKDIYNQLNSLLKSGVDFNDYGFNVNGSGHMFYDNLSRILGGDKNASMFLLENNVSGLRRFFADGWIDYIIFDENLLTIATLQENTSKGTNIKLFDQYGFAVLNLSNPEHFNAYKSVADSYIATRKANHLGANGYMFASSALQAQKNFKVLVPVELALAQMNQEGGFSIDPKAKPVRTINPFNIGNVDNGATKKYPNVSQAILSYYNLMARDYLNGKSVSDLLKNFVDYRGLRYASAPNYEAKVTDTLNDVKVISSPVYTKLRKKIDVEYKKEGGFWATIMDLFS
jgi:hypothetical protein